MLSYFYFFVGVCDYVINRRVCGIKNYRLWMWYVYWIFDLYMILCWLVCVWILIFIEMIKFKVGEYVGRFKIYNI